MSFEEEAAILAPYREKAEKGQLVETSEIKASYEKAVGHTIGGSQIYYVLKRHGWRKVMPRSRHPKKAPEEVIETSKKLKQKSQSSQIM
jgi:transposase